MAKFNGNIFKVMNEKEQKEEIFKILPMIQEIMTEDDFNKMREDFHGMVNNDIPFWKFVFESIEIKYVR